MDDLIFILTTAGLALANPANTGVDAILIDRIGISAVALPGDPEDHVGIVQLPNELKRLPTFGGDLVADDTIHVTIRDETADVYQLRTFGLYSSGGVLLAFCTSADAIMEKAASSMLLLAADLKFTTPIAAELVFGDTTFINPPATTDTKGVVELATAAETATGTDATRAVTPFGLKSLLTTLLAGFSPIGHTHAAADVTTGTFLVARIPDLAQAKITGLVDALAGKAAAAHTHVMSEIVGLVAALGAKLAITDFTWANLVGKPNVAINGQAAAFGALTSNGSAVWTAGNFDPATKANLASPSFTGSVLVRTAYPGADVFALAVGDGTSDIRALFRSSAPFALAVSQGVGSGNFYIGASASADPTLLFSRNNGTAVASLSPEGNFSASGTINEAGSRVWTAATFNPADKANAIHSHDWAQVTGKPAWVGRLSVNDAFLVHTNVHGTVSIGPASTSFAHIYTDRPAFYFNKAIQIEGFGVWHSGNFDPATKQKQSTISTAEPAGGADGDIHFVVAA